MNELKSRALKLLARREHTRRELAGKLADHGSPEEIDVVLNELARAGLQSDARFAESAVRSQAPRVGTARLRQVLRQKGIAPELIDAQLAPLAGDELERARVVWQKKFAVPPADAHEWARQARFLQGRGFAAETIRKLLREPLP